MIGYKKNYFKKGCISDDIDKVLDSYFIVKNRIGKDSAYAEAFQGCFPLNCKYKIAIKKIPVSRIDKKYIKTPESYEALNTSLVFSELFFLKITNLLVFKNICPHLPLVYDTYFCENKCTFENKQAIAHDPTIKDCILVVNELAVGDLHMLLTKIQPSIEHLKICFFQIYMGIYCIQKYFNLRHDDLHWGNVLFHKTNKKGYIRYIVKGHEIVIPNIGYLMVLWDFGLSYIPGKIDPLNKTYTKIDNKSRDYKMVTKTLMKDEEQKRDDYDILKKKLLHDLKISANTEIFVLEYGLSLHIDNIKEDEIIETYDTDKKLKIKNKNIQKILYKKK